jgi:hypothetical protein
MVRDSWAVSDREENTMLFPQYMCTPSIKQFSCPQTTARIQGQDNTGVKRSIEYNKDEESMRQGAPGEFG